MPIVGTMMNVAVADRRGAAVAKVRKLGDSDEGEKAGGQSRLGGMECVPPIGGLGEDTTGVRSDANPTQLWAGNGLKWA